MAKSLADVLPKEFAPNGVQSPREILRELARLMSQRTDHKLRAEVVSSTDSMGSFVHSFILSAPQLDYRGELFAVRHNESLYPVTITGKVVPAKITPVGAFRSIEAPTENDFIEAIGELARGVEMNQIIGALLAQLR